MYKNSIYCVMPRSSKQADTCIKYKDWTNISLNAIVALDHVARVLNLSNFIRFFLSGIEVIVLILNNLWSHSPILYCLNGAKSSWKKFRQDFRTAPILQAENPLDLPRNRFFCEDRWDPCWQGMQAHPLCIHFAMLPLLSHLPFFWKRVSLTVIYGAVRKSFRS